MSKSKVEEIEFTGGYNLLMLKAEEGNIDEVRRIITELKNIDINSTNKKGYTSLALAVKAGHFEIVKLLISLGGDPNIKNNSGQSPLFLACWNNYENLVKLLLSNGVEINAVDHRGWTPLMIAAYHSHRQIVKELLSNNADSTIQDLFGKKAIDRAKDQTVIKMLQTNTNKSQVLSPRKHDRSITYSSPQMSIDSKLGKNQPSSILKKSSSKASIGQSAKIEKYAPGLLSPQSTGGFSASKTQNSAQRRLTEPRRNSNQFKAGQRKEINSAEKVTPGLKNTLSEAISPIKTATSVRISNSPSSGLERQLFKEDMEKLLSDQMGQMCQKIQQIVEHKVALEIPMQMQGYENQFKKQVESLLRFKSADIFKNLQAIFNLKLKFCLNRLGYDTANLGLSPFLETETNFIPESISFAKEPLKLYNEKEFKAIENDIDRLEKSILSQKVNPSSVRSFHLESSSPKKGHRNCDHTSQTHRTEIKNDLIDHLGHEVRSTTEYLLDYSNTKVNELAREESGMLYKKILAEVTDNMEALEDELKKKFEEVITQKMNRITDILGSAAGSQAETYDTMRSAEKINSANQRNYPSALTNSSEYKFKPKYDADYGISNQPEEKYVQDYPSMRESGYSDKRANDIRAKGNQELSQAKQRIQRIKNSLNFMDDEEAESRPERLMQNGPNRNVGYDEYEREDNQQRAEVYEEEEQEEEAPQPERASEDPEEEIERIYNPTYRSTLKTAETQAQASNRDYWSQGPTKANTLSSRNGRPAQQQKGALEKSGGKIPQHRFAFNEKGKVDQEAYYNFANE